MSSRVLIRFHCLGHWSDWTDADAETRRWLQPDDWRDLRAGETIVQHGGLYQIRMEGAGETSRGPESDSLALAN